MPELTPRPPHTSYCCLLHCHITLKYLDIPQHQFVQILIHIIRLVATVAIVPCQSHNIRTWIQSANHEVFDVGTFLAIIFAAPQGKGNDRVLTISSNFSSQRLHLPFSTAFLFPTQRSISGFAFASFAPRADPTIFLQICWCLPLLVPVSNVSFASKMRRNGHKIK